MHFSRSLALVAAAAGLAIAAAPASAAFDHTINITADHATDGWSSADATGFNVSNQYDGLVDQAAYACTKDQYTYCDTALVHLKLSDVGGGDLKFRIEGFQQYSDFDLRVYPADATGKATGDYISPTGDSASAPLPGPIDPRETSAGDYETSTVSVASLGDGAGNVDAYFRVEIPYFAVVNDHYDFKLQLSGLTPFVPEDPQEE